MNLRRFSKIWVILICLLLTIAPQAFSAPPQFHFEISLVDIVEDTANAGLLGKPDWYQWIYKVEIVPTGPGKGYSHLTIELEDCYLDEKFLDAFEDTQGANGVAPNSGNLLGLMGDEHRNYSFTPGFDGSTGLYGIKWDLLTDDFETIGNYDYFWFSAPTDQIEEHTALVKHGQNLSVNEKLETPACPECTTHTAPEPASMALLASGLAALISRRKKISQKS